MKQQSWELPVDMSVLYLASSASSMEKGQYFVIMCLCEAYTYMYACQMGLIGVKINPNIIVGKEGMTKSLLLPNFMLLTQQIL